MRPAWHQCVRLVSVCSVVVCFSGTLAMLLAGCTETAPSSAPSVPPDPATTVTIERGSVATPRTLVVPLGSQVTFVNNDRIVHEMFSDPHPEHDSCPEFDAVGRLTPGESRQTTNLVLARTCNFHDHINPDIATLNGSIRIQ